jgi:hypothetical protein
METKGEKRERERRLSKPEGLGDAPLGLLGQETLQDADLQPAGDAPGKVAGGPVLRVVHLEQIDGEGGKVGLELGEHVLLLVSRHRGKVRIRSCTHGAHTSDDVSGRRGEVERASEAD